MASQILQRRNVQDTPQIPAFNTVLASISSIVVACRIYVRAIRTRNFGVDDACIIVAVGLTIFDAVTSFIFTHYGIGTPITHLTTDQVSQALKWLIISVVGSYLLLFFVRLSIGIFILRMVNQVHSKKRAAVWGLIAINLAATIMIVCVVTLWCRPIQGIWNKSIHAKCLSGSSLDSANRAFASVSAAIDIIFVCIPIAILWDLRMEPKTKRNIAIILGFGLVICACAIGKAVTVDETSADLTVSNAPALYWAVSEGNLGIVVASLPALRQFGIVAKQDYLTLRSRSRTSRTRSTQQLDNDADTTIIAPVNNAHMDWRPPRDEILYTIELGESPKDRRGL